MKEVHIDRLTLRLTGASEHDGRQLAQRVAEGLRASGIEGCARGRDRVRATVSGAAGSQDELARKIVNEVLSQLRRNA